MRNPLGPRHDENRWDRLVFTFVTVVGVLIIVFAGGAAHRPWIVTISFAAAVVFVLVYGRYNWRSTYPGRATMFAMRVTALYTGHTALVLWWRYPGWETGQTLVYWAILVSVAYKLLAMWRSQRARGSTDDDMTMDLVHR